MQRIYQGNGRLIEAKSLEEAREILKTDDVRSYRKPTKKEFMLWMWLHCGRKDGKLIKIMAGREEAPWLENYRRNPNVIKTDFAAWGIKPSHFVMAGEKRYDKERHDGFFYERGVNNA